MTGAQLAVEGLIGRGAPFEEIERYIETLALPSEQLGALWLLAWAEATDPVTRRRVVADAFAEPGDRLGRQPAASATRSRPEERQIIFLRHPRPGSKRGGLHRRP
jgi:hypothetical protein